MAENINRALRDALLAESRAWRRCASWLFRNPDHGRAFGYSRLRNIDLGYRMAQRHMSLGYFGNEPADVRSLAALLLAEICADEAAELKSLASSGGGKK